MHRKNGYCSFIQKRIFVKIIFFFLTHLIFSMVPTWGKNIIATEKNWRLSSSNKLTFEGSVPFFDSDLNSGGMTITQDGLHAYATSFISNDPADGGFINQYRINTKDGSLISERSMSIFDNPTGIVLSPDGQYAYVATRSGYVNRYQVNKNFSLTYIDQVTHSASYDWKNTAITISPNGHAIYTAVIGYMGDGHIDYFKINKDGSLTFQQDSIHTTMKYQFGICASPNGKFVYSTGMDGTNWYAVNVDGSLSYRGQTRLGKYISNHGIGISPNGRYIFTVECMDSVDCNLRLWKVNEHDGSLLDQGLVTSDTPTQLQAVTVAPNGKFIYTPAIGMINWYSDRENN